MLTEWTGRDFRRRRVEGRDSTVLDRDSTADVIPASGDIYFSIEAKCGVPSSFDGLLANPRDNVITKWWHQCCYDAHLLKGTVQHSVYPMLFFKPGKTQDWVAISQLAFERKLLRPVTFVNHGEVWFPHFVFDIYRNLGAVTHDVSHTKNKKMVPLILDPMILCRWKDFAANVDPDSFFV